MTQEQKDILLKDLCARLPYGVKIDNIGVPSMLTSINNKYRIIVETGEVDKEPRLDVLEIEDCKPYLFPFSSMTDEQKRELNNLVEESVFQILHSEDGNPQPQIPMDWYNKNHFDYRGLIPMGLANDATGLNIY